MDKKEFKKRWDSNDEGGGITNADVAACYVAWGLGSRPYTKPMETVISQVLKAAGVEEAKHG